MPSDSTDSCTPDGCTSTALRTDMVEAARQFMSTPKVRNTPFEEQKKFLLEKGVTEAEIDEALKSLPPLSTSNPTGPYPNQAAVYYQPPPPQTFGGRLYSFTQSIVVIGGASYMAYKFMRGYVLPKFFNIPEPGDERLENLQTQVNELQNSTKFIMDSVEQTLHSVSAQQEQLNRALMVMSQNNSPKGNDISRLQTDVAIVKSLLLNQNQFPAIPTTVPSPTPSNHINGVLKQPKTVRWQTNSVPSWQLAENGVANGSHNSNGHVNGKHDENVEDKVEEDEFLEAQNDYN